MLLCIVDVSKPTPSWVITMGIDFNQILINPALSALEAMRAINRGSVQIGLVTNEEKCLIGTLTDGDIRRGLLSGKSLETPVKELMNRDFKFLRLGVDRGSALELMRRDALLQLPVLDECGRVVELLLLSDLVAPSKKSNSVVIMAGGRGKRLLPLTEDCPKPMLTIAGKPMLEILLEQCIASGFSNFYFSVNYLKEQIIEYFQDGEKWGVSINYLIEDSPLGTAGSLQLLPSSIQYPVLVLNGDVLTRLNPSQLLQYHDEHKASATMCVREYTTSIPFGVVEAAGVEFLGLLEKPSYTHLVNAGVYVIDPSLLSLIPTNKAVDMPNFLQVVKDAGHMVAVCPVHEYWIDVGRPETLRQADQDWLIGVGL